MNTYIALLTGGSLLSGLIATTYLIRASRVPIERNPIAQMLEISNRVDDNAMATNATTIALKAADEARAAAENIAHASRLNIIDACLTVAAVLLNGIALLSGLAV
jgi:hypothetical protein